MNFIKNLPVATLLQAMFSICFVAFEVGLTNSYEWYVIMLISGVNIARLYISVQAPLIQPEYDFEENKATKFVQHINAVNFAYILVLIFMPLFLQWCGKQETGFWSNFDESWFRYAYLLMLFLMAQLTYRYTMTINSLVKNTEVQEVKEEETEQEEKEETGFDFEGWAIQKGNNDLVSFEAIAKRLEELENTTCAYQADNTSDQRIGELEKELVSTQSQFEAARERAEGFEEMQKAFQNITLKSGRNYRYYIDQDGYIQHEQVKKGDLKDLV